MKFLLSTLLLSTLSLASPVLNLPPPGLPGPVCTPISIWAPPLTEDCRKALSTLPTQDPPEPMICTLQFQTWQVAARHGSCTLATWSAQGDAHCLLPSKVYKAFEGVLQKCDENGKNGGYAALEGETVKGVWVGWDRSA